MGSNSQGNSRDFTQDVFNNYPPAGGSFTFASLRCLARDLICSSARGKTAGEKSNFDTNPCVPMETAIPAFLQF